MWSEHFSADVFERSGALNRLIRRYIANEARDRCDERIRICTGVDEKATAQKWTLFKGVVDGEGGLGNDILLVNIGDDANDALGRRQVLAIDFQDGIGPEYMPIDRVLIEEHALCKGFTDDCDALVALTIELIEVASRNDGDAQRAKEPRRDDTKLRARVLFARATNVTIGAELHGDRSRHRATGRPSRKRSH